MFRCFEFDMILSLTKKMKNISKPRKSLLVKDFSVTKSITKVECYTSTKIDIVIDIWMKKTCIIHFEKLRGKIGLFQNYETKMNFE